MEKGLKRYPERKLVPIQKNLDQWDRAYARIKLSPQEEANLDEELLKQHLALGLGLQLIEQYGVVKGVDETDGLTVYQVVAPFGPYEMKKYGPGGILR